MSNEWWSWILSAVGITGFVLAGRKVWWSWYINLGCQVLWFAYAIVTQQYGFIFAALAYSAVFTQNAIKWTKEYMAIPRAKIIFRKVKGQRTPILVTNRDIKTRKEVVEAIDQAMTYSKVSRMNQRDYELVNNLYKDLVKEVEEDNVSGN